MLNYSKNPFKSKIICKRCEKKYRSLTERGRKKFICGGYHNGNGCSERIVIEEDFIRDLINRRYQKDMSNEDILIVLDYVIVENKRLMEIHFKDGSSPILLKGSFIQF